MLIPRGIRFSQRLLSSSRKASPKLKLEDIEVLTNPDGKYVDAFMKYHGNDRSVFKASDIAQWQSTIDGYKFKSMWVKGTERLIGMAHICPFEPLDPSQNDPMIFMGFGWIDPEFRSPIAAKVQNKMCLDEVPEGKSNIVSQINEPGRKFWHIMCGLKEYDDVGHRTGDVGYKSFYDAKQISIPSPSSSGNLDFSNLTIRNAREVPKSDLIAYDQKIHPYHREKYLISHMYDRDGFGKVAYDSDGNVRGIGQAIIYPKNDCNLGPFYADEPRVAQAMFADILKDIRESGRFVSQFEIRSSQLCEQSFHWITPFLNCKPTRSHVCNLVYQHWVPSGIDFSKVYSPTHAQLFLV